VFRLFRAGLFSALAGRSVVRVGLFG
jgi:hypothetical protein